MHEVTNVPLTCTVTAVTDHVAKTGTAQRSVADAAGAGGSTKTLWCSPTKPMRGGSVDRMHWDAVEPGARPSIGRPVRMAVLLNASAPARSSQGGDEGLSRRVRIPPSPGRTPGRRHRSQQPGEGRPGSGLVAAAARGRPLHLHHRTFPHQGRSRRPGGASRSTRWRRVAGGVIPHARYSGVFVSEVGRFPVGAVVDQ